MRRLLRLSFALVALELPLASQTAAPSESLLNETTAIERASEEIAAVLADVSVAARNHDVERIAAAFGKEARIALPETGGVPTREYRWISSRRWSFAEPSKNPTAAFREFLGRFRAISDARFKVKAASFSALFDRGEIGVKFYIVGTNEEGLLEWMRATGKASVVKTSDGWLFDSFLIDDATSFVTERRLFAEVSDAAGVAYRKPPIFDPENLDPIFTYSHGGAAGDIDNDGRVDLFVAGKNVVFVYRNKGDGSFENLTAKLKLDVDRASAPLLVDADNDGDSDLFVTSIGKQKLFENRLVPEGKLRFRDISAAAGVDRLATGFSVVAGDVNGDALPDLFVASYQQMDAGTYPNNYFYATNGTPNLLFLNRGNLRFDEIAEESGVAGKMWTLSAQFIDVDEDGDQDLYVVNDFSENFLYRNQWKQGGRVAFTDATDEASLRGRHFGMGVSFGDYNNDGLLDLHQTLMSSTAGNRILGRFKGDEAPAHLAQLKMLAAGNRLYQGLGGGRFRDVTNEAGPFPAGWAWGGGFVDFDNDGWQDLHSGNGMLSGKELTDT